MEGNQTNETIRRPHKFLEGHAWKTLSEQRIPGYNGPIEAVGFSVEDTIKDLREGYMVFHQECIICGDRRKLREK